MSDKRFMVKFPRYEPTIRDHTAVNTFMTCPRKYFYRIVLGFKSRGDAPYFAWGSAYHKFREVLEATYGYGDNAPRVFDIKLSEKALLEATRAGLQYWNTHGQDQPVGSKFDWMTGPRLIQVFRKAFDHWVQEKQRGRIQVLAIEQFFIVELEDGSSTTGRADQIVRWNGKLWGRDFKTTSKEEAFIKRAVTPNDQFTRYTVAESKMAGESVNGQLIEYMYNAKSTKTQQKGPAIFTIPATRTPGELEEWEREQTVINKFLDACRESDIWPMATNSCVYCEYHSVCSKPTEGAMMSQLQTHFVCEPWDPSHVGD